MKDILSPLIKEVIKEKMVAVDEFIEQNIKPLEVTTNPEKLLGKPYALWSPQDKQLLASVYGTGSDSRLVKTIVNKEYEQVKALEADVA